MFFVVVLINVFGLVILIFIMVVYDRVLFNEVIELLVVLIFGMGLVLFFDFLIKLLCVLFIDRVG